MYARDVPPGTVFYHGTKADLAVGDLIRPGFGSGSRVDMLRSLLGSIATMRPVAASTSGGLVNTWGFFAAFRRNTR